MLENSAFYSRLLFAFVLVCAAVMSFIMCSDAARVCPIAAQVDDGVKHNVLRRPYTPYSHCDPPSAGLLSTDTGSQTGINSETKTRGNYRKTLSIINPQSNGPQFPEGSSSYSQKFPDNRHARAGIGGVSEVRPKNSIFTNHFHPRFTGRQSRENYQPRAGNSQNPYPPVIRKSSHKEAASPFSQSSSSSQVWEPSDAQKSYNGEKVPRNDPPKVLKRQPVWQTPGSLFSSQTGGYWSTSPPPSRALYSGYEETNEMQSPSSGIQSSKFRGFASQTVPHVPSVSNSLDASVIKSDSRLEKLTSSITDFSQGSHLVSSGKTQRHKKLQSYLFKDSQVSFGRQETVKAATGDGSNTFSTTSHRQRPPDAQVYGRFSSNLNQSPREPTQEVKTLSNNAKQLYRNTNVAQYGAETDSFTQYQHTTVGTPGRDDTVESLVPVPHDTGSEKSVVSSFATTTTGGSVQPYKPGWTIKSIYDFRGVKFPSLGAVKEPSVASSSGSKERTGFSRYNLDKGKFKIANTFPSLSPKYMFGQRAAKARTAPPAEIDKMTPADFSSPPPGTSDIVQTSTTSRRIVSGFKEAVPVMPENIAGRDSNPDHKQFRINRRQFTLKGFDTRPLEGAKTSVPEPEKSRRVQQGFKGFKLAGSQIWQPKSSRIHGWYNKIGETELGSSHVSTGSQNEQSSEDLEPHLKTTGSPESRFRPDKYKNSQNIYSSLGFRSLQNITGSSDNKNVWKYKQQNPSESHRISSAYLRLAGDFQVESSPKSDTRPPSKTKPVEMRSTLFNSSTSSTVRAKRVKGNRKKLSKSPFLINDIAIIRLPKLSAKLKAITYTDILGSASFSGVRAVTPTTITPPDKDYSLNATATTRQEEREGHQTPPDEAEDFSSVEESKLVVGNDEAESDVKTLHFFLENNGSGSGGFNMSDALSTDITKGKGHSENLSELDYLRISTGNVSFKSIKRSPSEK